MNVLFGIIFFNFKPQNKWAWNLQNKNKKYIHAEISLSPYYEEDKLFC
jgi:hypothetical protein